MVTMEEYVQCQQCYAHMKSRLSRLMVLAGSGWLAFITTLFLVVALG